MTDIRRCNEARVHQPPPPSQLPAAYHGSGNSTPELLHTRSTHTCTYPAPASGRHQHQQQQQSLQYAAGGCRKPLLQSLADHINLSSISGGSTTSSGATAIVGGSRRNCTAANPNSGVQFDERDFYYVSPSKRKNITSSGGGGNIATAAATFFPHATLRAACERLKSSPASVAPSYPAIMPSAAYGARTAGQAHDFSFDSCDSASHYSDSAMHVLRSTVAAEAMPLDKASGNLMQQHATSLQRTAANNVTFSSPVDEMETRPVAAAAQANRSGSGSLRRSKGRSNQSLCSCDAGADTEINPDPTRPLFEYSLERGSKRHTYTCEQNAQILLRLERERNRKLNFGNKEEGQQQIDARSCVSDVDAIPPVPPPPALKRNGSVRSLKHQQRQTSSISGSLRHSGAHNNSSNHSNNHTNNSRSTLCSSDLLNDCAANALDVGSLIDDCTSSILKCANAVSSELFAATTAVSNSNSSGGGRGGGTEYAVKPDVCHVDSAYGDSGLTSHYPRDDLLLMPNGKQSDPAMCFLYLDGGRGTMPQVSRAKKYNTIGPSSDCARQLSSLLAQQQQQEQHFRHLSAAHCQCLSQSLTNFTRDYFGQSGLQKSPPECVLLPAKQPLPPHIFYTNDRSFDKHEPSWSAEPTPPTPPPPPPLISRSFGDLIAGEKSAHASSHLAFLKFNKSDAYACGNNGGAGNNKTTCNLNPANSSSSSTINNSKLINNSFTALSTSTSSGLKDKFQQHHQLAHLHHHQQLHPQQQQQQQQVAGKQQQLHASLTSIMPWKHRQCPSRGSSSSGSNSFRFDAAKHWLAVSSILLIIGAASVAVPLVLRVAASAPFEERLQVAVQLLDQVPLIDGHNDLPWNIRKFLHNKLNDFNFDDDLRNVNPWAKSQWSHTDLQRLKRGRVAAQFWAAYVPCEAQHRDAVQLTLEQIDVIKRLTDRYAPQLTTCTSADDIREAHKNHQLCSLTGVEGGHSLGGSLAVLRTLYAIGVRYMTLTSTCHTPWADSSYADAPTFNVKHGGLTIFGKTIIREMNRLGMMVDLSHVSTGTMRDALEVSEAPVIFSHSSAYEVCNSSRNVQDDMLQSLAKNGGLVMVNFYSKFLSCSENSTVHDAVAHINHIKRIAGIDHVGLGAGFDGINFTPKGLEDVSTYPTLFAELLGVGWSIDDLAKLAGGNFLRVMQQVEKVRDEKKAAGVKPYEDHPNFRTDDPYNCTSS